MTNRLSSGETAKYLLLCKIVSFCASAHQEESLESKSNFGPRQIAILRLYVGAQNSAYRYKTKNMKNPLAREDFSNSLAFLFQLCYTSPVSVARVTFIVNNISATKTPFGAFLFCLKITKTKKTGGPP